MTRDLQIRIIVPGVSERSMDSFYLFWQVRFIAAFQI